MLPAKQMSPKSYRQEAMLVSDEVKRRHVPAIRSLHLQKNFPETRKLLQPPQGRLSTFETPRELKDVTFPPHNNHRTKWERDDKSFAETNPRGAAIAHEERHWGDGHRKQLMYRAEEANVNYIISQQDRDGRSFKPGESGLQT